MDADIPDGNFGSSCYGCHVTGFRLSCKYCAKLEKGKFAESTVTWVADKPVLFFSLIQPDCGVFTHLLHACTGGKCVNL